MTLSDKQSLAKTIMRYSLQKLKAVNKGVFYKKRERIYSNYMLNDTPFLLLTVVLQVVALSSFCLPPLFVPVYIFLQSLFQL